MFKINPGHADFYGMFLEAAKHTTKTAEMLLDLMENYNNVETKINAIEEMEHQCDIRIHDVLQQLNKTFITPIDREDIFLIAKELDNITDAIETAAHRFKMFNVSVVTEDAKKLGKMIVECTRELQNVMSELKDMTRSTKLGKNIIEVNRIEDDGDNVFRKAITSLFVSGKDPVEIIKWKEIYEILENTLDACEDVANAVEGVVMKNA